MFRPFSPRWSSRSGPRSGAGRRRSTSDAEDGCDIFPLRQYLKKLGCNENSAIWRGCHVCIATGGFWPQSRRHEAGLTEQEVTCARCDAGVPETPLHRHWQCAGNARIPACVDTQDLEEAAQRDADEFPCFWHRGLVPASWTQTRCPSDTEEYWDWSFGEILRGTGNQWWAGGDGSGGEHSRDPRLRRAGWSYVVAAEGVSREPEAAAAERGLRGRAGNIPGPVQTVNRGELLAAVVYAEECGAEGRNLHYVTDSAYVVRGWLRHGTRKPRSHRDLWKRLRAATDERGCCLTVHKVESHLDEAEAEMRGFPLLHVRLNQSADDLAARAAQRVALGAAEVHAVLDVDQRAARVRQRLAAILQDVGDKSERLPRQPREAGCRQAFTPFDEALAATQHEVVGTRGIRGGASRMRCRSCLSEVRGSRATCTAWLRTPCAGPPRAPAAGTGPEPAGGARASGMVQVGGRTVHPSHDLRAHADVPVWYCARCGATTAREGGVLKGLAGPCLPAGRPVSQAGQEALGRLARGLWPGTSQAARSWNAGRLAHEGRGAKRR